MFNTRAIKRQTRGVVLSNKKQTSRERSGSTKQIDSLPGSTHFLQRNLGNSYLQSMTESPQTLGRHNTHSGVSTSGQNFSHASLSSCYSGKKCEISKIQTKLTIGPANDVYEQEADRVADLIVGMPESRNSNSSPLEGLKHQPLDNVIQRVVDKVEQNGDVTEQREEGEGQPLAVFVPLQQTEESAEELEEPETIQRKPDDYQPVTTSRSDVKGIPHISTGGRPLPSDVKSNMEHRFGIEFSEVRIHQDQQADSLSQGIGARAFTYKNHIYFAKNEFQPSTKAGQHLLAHELTHTIQQGAVGSGKIGTNNSNVRPKMNAVPSMQRTIDLSIQFDAYSLSSLLGAVPRTGGAVGGVLRDIENTGYSSFGARNPVTSMNLTDTWYYYNPIFTNSLYATRSWWLVNFGVPINGYWRANDVYRFSFNYRHTATRPRTGSFQVTSGTSRSRTNTITGGATLSYSVLELSGSASTARTTGATAGTQVTTTNYYEHGYNVSLGYNVSYYNQSDFTVRRGFWGPRIVQVGGPHALSGTVNIGTCTVKDDDSNPDNLTP